MEFENTVETTETSEQEELNLAADLARSFAVATAVTAGTIAGFAIVGAVYNKIQLRKQRKFAETLETETTPKQ